MENAAKVMPQIEIVDLPKVGYLRTRQLFFTKKNEVLEGNSYPIFPWHRTKAYKLIREGKFPKPIKLSSNTAVWKVSTILELIEKINAGEWTFDDEDGGPNDGKN